MDKIYANLIIHGLRTIEDVPKALRKKVERTLKKHETTKPNL